MVEGEAEFVVDPVPWPHAEVVEVVDLEFAFVVVVDPVPWPHAEVVEVVDLEFAFLVVVDPVPWPHAEVVVVVDVGTGFIPGIGGFFHTCIAFGIDGCFKPGKPDPNAVRTFLVICTTGAIGQLPINDGHGDPSAATQRLVPVAKTPAPLGVV